MKWAPKAIAVYRFRAGKIQKARDSVALEEPLSISINEEDYTTTMRTPGHDHELAAGLLFSEGIIRNSKDLFGHSTLP